MQKNQKLSSPRGVAIMFTNKKPRRAADLELATLAEPNHEHPNLEQVDRVVGCLDPHRRVGTPGRVVRGGYVVPRIIDPRPSIRPAA